MKLKNSQRWPILFGGYAILLLVSYAGSIDDCPAQSTVVRTNKIETNQSTFSVDGVGFGLRTNLAAAVINTERVLQESVFSPVTNEMSVRELISTLESLGVKVFVSESAEDEGLDEDEHLKWPAAGVPYSANLRLLLNDYECGYTIDSSGIVIISSYDELDERLFSLLIDIGQLGLTDDMVYSINENVHADTWLETGTGLGVIELLPAVNGGKLLHVSNRYDVVFDVRKYLAELSSGSNATDSKRRSQMPTSSPRRAVLSAPIRLPSDASNSDQGFTRRRPMPDGGFGGAGMGGGVF